MSNLQDLNNHLFDQLKRLSDKDLTPEQIEQEAKRSDAIVKLSDQILDGAKMQLGAAKLFAEHGRGVLEMLPQIGGPKKGKDE